MQRWRSIQRRKRRKEDGAAICRRRSRDAAAGKIDSEEKLPRDVLILFGDGTAENFRVQVHRSRTGPDAWRLTQSRKDLGATTPRLAETEGGESSLRLGRYESIIVRLANRSMIDPIELSLKLRLRNRLESNVAEHRAPGRLRHACPTCSPQLASFCIVSQLFQCFPTRLAGCKYRGPRFYNSSDFIDRRGTGSRGRCISIQRARLQTSSFTAY